jgi:hypothetical protein
MIQIGNGGAGGGELGISTKSGEWQHISACGRKDTLNNEVVIYSSGGPAVSYVDDAWVGYDPSC